MLFSLFFVCGNFNFCINHLFIKIIFFRRKKLTGRIVDDRKEDALIQYVIIFSKCYIEGRTSMAEMDLIDYAMEYSTKNYFVKYLFVVFILSR